MKKFLKYAMLLVIISSMLLLLIYADRYSTIAKEGICLWALTVVPSLFPFFFLTMLITGSQGTLPLSSRLDSFTKKHFRCSGSAVGIFLLSVVSGYPVGAKLIADLYSGGAIDSDEATRMSTFCSTSGPMFVVGTVGVCMFESGIYGAAMLISHIISAIICGKIFCRSGDFKNHTNIKSKNKTNANILQESMYSSVISILCVGGFICIFYVLSAMMRDFKIIDFFAFPIGKIMQSHPSSTLLSKGFVTGLIECTNGCKILSAVKDPLSASLACGVISFGGLSVIMQSSVYLTQAKVRLRVFLLSKLIQCTVAFLLCLCIIKLSDIL